MRLPKSWQEVRPLLVHPYFFIITSFVALLPLLLIGSSFFSRRDALQEIDLAVNRLHLKQMRLKERGGSEEAFLAKMQHADRYYIDKHLETLLFLEPEIAQLELQNDPAYRKRCQFLQGGENRFLFVEGEIRRGDLFQEVEERLQHPVEMDEEDLKRVLCLVEEVELPPYKPLPNAPQLIVKNLELTRKAISPDQEVYHVNLQLIKREGIP